jgi:hypothetical protein
MNQKQLSETIGTSERTLRRMSPTKRQQWQALAAKGRTIAWFDVLAQLCFEVDAFNASKDGGYEWIWLQLSGSSASITHFNIDVDDAHLEIYNINQLTEALSYVRGLNN